MLDSYETSEFSSAPANLSGPAASPGDATGAGDRRLACMVREALADLARHSNAYARVLANRSGVRLAYHVRAGQVDRLSAEGRQAMRSVYQTMVAATAVRPGLDTNTFLEQLKGRSGAASDSSG